MSTNFFRYYIDLLTENVSLSNEEIPIEILTQADSDPELVGFVEPNTKKSRLAIKFNDDLVGFMTPRMDANGYWRTGAIYILPEFRSKGIGGKAINEFFKDKKGMAVIEVNNKASHRSFEKAGFTIKKHREIDGEMFNILTND